MAASKNKGRFVRLLRGNQITLPKTVITKTMQGERGDLLGYYVAAAEEENGSVIKLKPYFKN